MKRLMRLPGKMDKRTLPLLGGLCFFLSAMEFVIPKPLPFIRLGLANLPLLLALDTLGFSSLMLLAAIKIIGQALITGTLFSYVFLFSLGGTGISVLLMYAIRRRLGSERISLIGVSVAGAFASNGATLLMAYFFVFGESVRYAAAPVLALGLVTGALLGLAAEYFIGRSAWYAGLCGSLNAFEEKPDLADKAPAADSATQKTAGRLERFRRAREDFCRKHFSSGDLAAAGLCMMPALLLNRNVFSLAAQFLFFFLLAALAGKKIKLLLTFLVMLFIVVFNLLVPYGELLFSLGPLAVTKGALFTGISRAATLEGLFMLSRCFVRQDLALPGSFGELVGESFRVFSYLSGEKLALNGRNWVAYLDGLLGAYPASIAINSGANNGGAKKEPEPKRFRPAILVSRIVLVAVTILAWLPLLVGFAN